ncbi:MAG: hypothetical protein JWM11_1471 [Planctomycetaceae bacterium]|nr:hypothetical protein [Planctomycetaceae bacterium]
MKRSGIGLSQTINYQFPIERLQDLRPDLAMIQKRGSSEKVFV